MRGWSRWLKSEASQDNLTHILIDTYIIVFHGFEMLPKSLCSWLAFQLASQSYSITPIQQGGKNGLFDFKGPVKIYFTLFCC